MKHKIKKLIHEAASKAFGNKDMPSDAFPDIEVEVPKIETHGDFSTNMAMVMASIQKMPPRKIAEAIINNMADSEGILEKTEIAGPGFINFFLNNTFWYSVLDDIHRADQTFGASDTGTGKKIQVEFVSANPTGPLHVGHGRGAAVGDAMAAVLSFCGFDVEKEYYINDSGRQINTLGRSVFLRIKELTGMAINFPDDCYQGDYIRDLAETMYQEKGQDLLEMTEEEAVEICARFAAGQIMDGIRTDLESFGVDFDNWFSEQTLYDSGKVDEAIDHFKARNMVYEKDGAFWFKTSEFGDEKDRVVVRQNGQTTYFASDIAYHREKFERGFDRVIDVWGADHHGYIPRVKASIEASGLNKDQFDVILVQLVNLLRGGEPVAMSTRAGEFVTLKDVVDEVGKDAARFIFLTRHYESPLDFDLEVAKKKSNDNPVYYVQYVHARISSIAEKAIERGITSISSGDRRAELLKEYEEIQLIKVMANYPEVVRSSAEMMEPHRIAFYLLNLASAFHAYYNKHRVLTDDTDLSGSRLHLVLGVQKVIRNGLSLLGVTAPEKM